MTKGGEGGHLHEGVLIRLISIVGPVCGFEPYIAPELLQAGGATIKLNVAWNAQLGTFFAIRRDESSVAILQQGCRC